MSQRDLDRLERLSNNIIDENFRRRERELALIYRELRDEVESKLSDIYKRYAVDGQLTRAEMTKYNRLTNLEKDLNKLTGKASGRANRLISRLTEEQYDEAFFAKSWMIEQHVGVGISWGSVPSDAIEEILDNDLSRIGKERLRRNSSERIRRSLATGLGRGDSYTAMAKEVEQAINGNLSDAKRIARTESHRAQVAGAEACYKRAQEKGVRGYYVWSATLDNVTRDSHGAIDGDPKHDEEKGWRLPSGVWAIRPGESGDPSEDINCRCGIEFRVEGLEPNLRRTRDKDIERYRSYSQWKADRVR